MIAEETPWVLHEGSGSLGPFSIAVDGAAVVVHGFAVKP